MIKIILGTLLVLSVVAINTSGVATYIETQAALKTVNGGGLEYQIARSVSDTANLQLAILLLAGVLIFRGLWQRLMNPSPKN